MSRTIKAILGLIIAVVVLGGGWYLASPLFIDNTVNEAFPVALPSVEEASGMSGEALESAVNSALAELDIDTMSEEQAAALQERVETLAATMPDSEIEDPMPEATTEPIALRVGSFIDADSAHRGTGSATLYELPDGSRVLRFEAFEVTNGPDLHVILTKHPNPESRDDIGSDYIDLGSIKGNIGSQNYDIPTDLDLSEYQSVVIYCMPFHVVFSTATIQ